MRPWFSPFTSRNYATIHSKRYLYQIHFPNSAHPLLTHASLNFLLHRPKFPRNGHSGCHAMNDSTPFTQYASNTKISIPTNPTRCLSTQAPKSRCTAKRSTRTPAHSHSSSHSAAPRCSASATAAPTTAPTAAPNEQSARKGAARARVAAAHIDAHWPFECHHRSSHSAAPRCSASATAAPTTAPTAAPDEQSARKGAARARVAAANIDAHWPFECHHRSSHSAACLHRFPPAATCRFPPILIF